MPAGGRRSEPAVLCVRKPSRWQAKHPMTSDRMAINSGLIRWARERAGYSLEAAERHFRDIRAWGSCGKAPTYVQLESVADRFKVPVSVLFFPEPPDVPEPSRSFRTLPERGFAGLPPRMHLLVRKAQAFQISLAELTEGRSPPGQPLLQAFRDGAPDPGELRAVLGVSLDDQRGWPDAPAAFREWRDALCEAGVFVFKDAFRQDDYCGFSIYDPELPVIYVNSSRSATRQISPCSTNSGTCSMRPAASIRCPPTCWIAFRRRAAAWRPAATASPPTCCYRRRSWIA